MSFQIIPLEAESLSSYFGAGDAELASAGIRRVVADASPGYPCRVSLQDAEIGEAVLLMNHVHQPEGGPYRASHAIFVREHAQTARVEPDTVPLVISRRLISVRAFDESHDMVGADVVDGAGVAGAIEDFFCDSTVSYLHLHNAKPGCFAAKVVRSANKSG